MSLREKNGKWEYRFRIQGQRVTKLTGLAATAENRIRAEKLEQKHRDSIMRGDQPVLRQVARGFTDASREFMDAVAIQHEGKQNTVRRIETSLASLRQWFAQKAVCALSAADVERYSVWRRKQHQVQPITLRHDLDALSKFLEWAVRMNLTRRNVVRDVQKPSTEGAVRMHVLTPAEEFDYFTRIEEHGYENLGDVARLILDQGMRPDEVLRLERRGVDLIGARVTIYEGKTKAARRKLRLSPQACMIVQRRMQDPTDSRWLFPSPKCAGEPLKKLNGPHDKVCAAREPSGEGSARSQLNFVLYDLRHTFATRAAQAGMDLATLAAILGHSSLRMVLKYVHVQQTHMDAEMDRFVRETAAQAPSRPHTSGDQGYFARVSVNDRDVLN